MFVQFQGELNRHACYLGAGCNFWAGLWCQPAQHSTQEVLISMPNVPLDAEELQSCISGSQATLVPSERLGKSRSGIEVDAEGW